MHTRTQIHLGKYSRRSKYDLTVITRATKAKNNRIQLNLCTYTEYTSYIHNELIHYECSIVYRCSCEHILHIYTYIQYMYIC